MSNNEDQSLELEGTQEELSEILRVRREKYDNLVKEGKDPFEITTFHRENSAEEILSDFEKWEGKYVSLAGRIMSWRDMGKAAFMDVLDQSGRIQLYVRTNVVGEETYNQLKYWDIGDIIGLAGEVFKTKHGEISIRVKEMKLLSKSLQPLLKNGMDLRIRTFGTDNGM